MLLPQGILGMPRWCQWVATLAGGWLGTGVGGEDIHVHLQDLCLWSAVQVLWLELMLQCLHLRQGTIVLHIYSASILVLIVWGCQWIVVMVWDWDCLWPISCNTVGHMLWWIQVGVCGVQLDSQTQWHSWCCWIPVVLYGTICLIHDCLTQILWP